MQSYSAWEVWSQLKKDKPVAYPNVLNRIKKLVSLGLLEQESGEFKRNAIKYRLTSRGLFERLLLGEWDVNPTVWLSYIENIILQTILYRYFEIKTISKFTKDASSLLATYLRECCETILEINNIQQYMISGVSLKQYSDLVEDGVEYRVKRYVHTVVMYERGKYTTLDCSRTFPHKVGVFPIEALRNDYKFTEVLRKIKDEFNESCKKFLE